jgi:hypothetical protein
MKLSIAHLRAAGLTDRQIVSVLEEAELEQREKWRKQKQYQRSCPQDSVDSADIHSLTSFSSTTESVSKKEESKNLSARQGGQCGQQFDEFWEIYPNKVGKPAARRAFPGALCKVSLTDLIVGLRRYMVHKPADRQWLNPATFLNQERWADQPAKVESNGNGRHPANACSAAIERIQQQISEGELDFGSPENGHGLLPKG